MQTFTARSWTLRHTYQKINYSYLFEPFNGGCTSVKGEGTESKVEDQEKNFTVPLQLLTRTPDKCYEKNAALEETNQFEG